MKIEQNGPETCKVSNDRGFVLVRVPVRILGDTDSLSVTYRYTIGGFVGRETKLPLGGTAETALGFRVPRELFRDRERFSVEVLRTDERGVPRVLWTSRREVHWAKDNPMLEALPEIAPTE